MLRHLGAWLRLTETTASKVNEFLEIVNNLPGSMPFICKPTNPKPIVHNYLLYVALILRATTHQPRARYRAIRDSPYFQSPLRLFELANSKPV